MLAKMLQHISPWCEGRPLGNWTSGGRRSFRPNKPSTADKHHVKVTSIGNRDITQDRRDASKP